MLLLLILFSENCLAGDDHTASHRFWKKNATPVACSRAGTLFCNSANKECQNNARTQRQLAQCCVSFKDCLTDVHCDTSNITCGF